MIPEWIIAIAALLISIVFFAMTFTFPTVPGDPGGGALFPRVLSIITGVAAVFLVLGLLRKHRPDTRSPGESLKKFWGAWKKGPDDESSIIARRMTYVFIFSIVYPWFMIRAGFLLSTGAYVFLLMKLFRTKTVTSAVLSIITALGLHFFFIKVLEAYVPPGVWLESIFE